MMSSKRDALPLPLIEKLLFLMMVSFPLDMFSVKVSGFGLSMGRTLFFISAFLFLVHRLFSRRLVIDNSVLLGLLAIVSVFLSLFSSSNLDMQLTRYFLPSYLVGIMVYVLCYSAFLNNGKLIRTFSSVVVFWTIIIALFSMYSLHSFYVLEVIPLRSMLNEHAIWIAASKRLFLPTATPPHLSLFAALTSIWWLMVYFRRRSRLALFLSLGMLAVCLLTFSRSGLLAYFVSVAGVIFYSIRHSGQSPISGKGIVLIFLLLLGVFAYPLFQEQLIEEYGALSAARITSVNSELGSIDNHIRYRLQAFEIFGNGTFLEKLFGVGVGNFERIEEGSTYSFSIYLTSLAEQGLLGSLVMLAIFGLPLFQIFRRGRKGRELFHVYRLAFALSAVLFFGNLFYEYKVFVPMWITIAWLHAVMRSQPAVLRGALSDFCLDMRRPEMTASSGIQRNLKFRFVQSAGRG
jgi:hypothetical protein